MREFAAQARRIFRRQQRAEPASFQRDYALVSHELLENDCLSLLAALTDIAIITGAVGARMAHQGIFYVHIHVSDLARTKRFYGETLGWRLDTDQPEVGGFWFGSGYLVAGTEQRPQGERRYSGGMHVAVRVDDLEAEHEKLTTRGVVVTAIQSRPWGQRDFWFSDPDGYRWEYAQAKG